MKNIITLSLTILALVYTLPLFAQNKVGLTEPEKEYLKQHKVLNYVADPSWLPYEAYNSKFEHIGIIPGVLQLIKSNTGTEINLNLSTLKSESWQNSLELATSQHVDILSSDPLDPTLQDRFIATDTYLTSPIVIIMTNNNNYVARLSYIENKKIAVVKDYGYVRKLQQHYPQVDFLFVKDIKEGLQGVSEQKYDAFLASATAATYRISQSGINNLSIVGSTRVNMDLSFFVKKDNVLLLSILNKLILSLAPEDIHKVMTKWSVVKFTQKVDYELIFKIVASFFIILTITFAWNQQLKKSKNKIKELNKKLTEKVDELEVLSTTDSMTGLYNRRHFEKVFLDELNRAKRNGYKLVFAMLDVDHFKKYNDTYGHDNGDKVLIKIGNIMQDFTQRANEFAFRIGGEEFCVISSNLDDKAAFSFVEKLRVAIVDSKMEHSGNSASAFVTASFGVVIVDTTQELTTEFIYKTADNILYQAKESGRNRVLLTNM